MPTIVCECGTEYQFPAENLRTSAGRPFTCHTCGTTRRLPLVNVLDRVAERRARKSERDFAKAQADAINQGILQIVQKWTAWDNVDEAVPIEIFLNVFEECDARLAILKADVVFGLPSQSRKKFMIWGWEIARRLAAGENLEWTELTISYDASTQEGILVGIIEAIKGEQERRKNAGD